MKTKPLNIKKVKKYTELATDDADLAHLTKEVLLEARTMAKPIKKSSGYTEGNTFHYQDGKWHWRERCFNNWLVWGGNARAERNGTCVNGFIRYNITWW
jgi:hypothetical protein